MNITIENKTKILQELNENEFIFTRPSFAIISFLMFFGVIGNVIVIYVYGCRLKRNIVQYFVTLLAIFDLGSCLIGGPLCLTILRLPLLFPSNILCKSSGFLVYFMSLASGFTLLAISAERYKKLCQPAKSTLSKNLTRCITVGIIILATLIASPTLIIYKRIVVNTTHIDIAAYSCMKIPVHDYKVYYGFLFFTVTFGIILIIVSNLFIWKRLRGYYLRVKTTYTSNEIPNGISTLSSSVRRKLIQTTKMMITVTVLFVATFVPMIIYLGFCSLHPHHFSDAEKIYSHVLQNLWIFNSSMNPLVYGFLCKSFRREIRKTLKLWVSFR